MKKIKTIKSASLYDLELNLQKAGITSSEISIFKENNEWVANYEVEVMETLPRPVQNEPLEKNINNEPNKLFDSDYSWLRFSQEMHEAEVDEYKILDFLNFSHRNLEKYNSIHESFYNYLLKKINFKNFNISSRTLISFDSHESSYKTLNNFFNKYCSITDKIKCFNSMSDYYSHSSLLDVNDKTCEELLFTYKDETLILVSDLKYPKLNEFQTLITDKVVAEDVCNSCAVNYVIDLNIINTKKISEQYAQLFNFIGTDVVGISAGEDFFTQDNMLSFLSELSRVAEAPSKEAA